MNVNQSLDKTLKKTLWLWLPFFAFTLLIKWLIDARRKRS